MPTKKKTAPVATESYVDRALDGMARRLHAGNPLSDKECTLFCALLQCRNNRTLLNDHDLLEEWDERFSRIENWINSRQAIQAAARPQRRHQQPPNSGGLGFDVRAQG